MGNRGIIRWVFIICTGVMSIALSASAQAGWLDPTADRVGEGNRLYEREKYDDALGKYTDAQINDPESPIIHFNIADAHYKNGKYDEAISAYEKTLRTDDITLGAKAYYNIGNAKYRQGKLNEALDYYKRAIELSNDPDASASGGLKEVNADAKYNHEFVEKKIKEQMNEQNEQQQKDEPQQEKQKDKKEESEQQNKDPHQEDKNKDPEQQDSSQKPQEHPEDKEKGESPPPQGQQEQQEQQKQGEGESNEQEQDMTQAQHDKREMSEEEAERVLEALGRSEKEAREWMAKQRHGIPGRVEKDW